MAATHIFHKLVFSARLFLKKASWGCCMWAFGSSGEPAVHPELSDSLAPGCSGTEFEVGRITSCEDGVGATVHAAMDYELSMNWSTFCIRRDLGRFRLCSFSGSIEVPAVDFGEGDISTDAETRRQRRSRSARISRRLVFLARSASASLDFSGRNHSRTLMTQAFDDGIYHSNWGLSRWCSTAVPQFRCFDLDHFSADPAITSIIATCHQLVSLCHSVCAEERA